jgi:hypothetical protein
MFAAMPSDNARGLEYFRLALLLIDRGTKDLPPLLSEHFNQVLHQARLLVIDPTSVSPSVVPQAVHLANDLLRVTALRDALEGVEKIADVNAVVAHNVLRNMEPNFASPD